LSLRFHIEILRFYYYLLFVLENIGSCNNGTRRKDKDGELLKDSKITGQNRTDRTDVKKTKLSILKNYLMQKHCTNFQK
jgi:hypothetical protein